MDPALMEELEQNKKMLDLIKQEKEEYQQRLEEQQRENLKRQQEEERLKDIPHLKNIN